MPEHSLSGSYQRRDAIMRDATMTSRAPLLPPPCRSGPRPSALTVLLSTTGALLSAFLATLFFGSLAVLFAWVPPRGRLMLFLSRRWARVILAASGARVRVSFAAPLDRRQSYVYLANHQSYFDIPALLPVIPSEVRFAAKRSLFRIPIFGWSLHAGGFIPIDRDDKSKARENVARAASWLKGGVSVLFFPEGTRSADGRIAPLARGGFLLAMKCGLPIVPVGVRGADRVQPRGHLTTWPGTIEVRFGAPIDPATYGVRRARELAEMVRREIAELAGAELAPAPVGREAAEEAGPRPAPGSAAAEE